VLKQGVRPRAIDAAERSLVKRGLIRVDEHGIQLTPKGLKVTGRACPRIDLPPWDNRAIYR
jgi:flagellar basal body rod protein FlgF